MGTCGNSPDFLKGHLGFTFSKKTEGDHWVKVGLDPWINCSLLHNLLFLVFIVWDHQSLSHTQGYVFEKSQVQMRKEIVDSLGKDSNGVQTIWMHLQACTDI